jgi:hypothetical protein
VQDQTRSTPGKPSGNASAGLESTAKAIKRNVLTIGLLTVLLFIIPGGITGSGEGTPGDFGADLGPGLELPAFATPQIVASLVMLWSLYAALRALDLHLAVAASRGEGPLVWFDAGQKEAVKISENEWIERKGAHRWIDRIVATIWVLLFLGLAVAAGQRLSAALGPVVGAARAGDGALTVVAAFATTLGGLALLMAASCLVTLARMRAPTAARDEPAADDFSGRPARMRLGASMRLSDGIGADLVNARRKAEWKWRQVCSWLETEADLEQFTGQGLGNKIWEELHEGIESDRPLPVPDDEPSEDRLHFAMVVTKVLLFVVEEDEARVDADDPLQPHPGYEIEPVPEASDYRSENLLIAAARPREDDLRAGRLSTLVQCRDMLLKAAGVRGRRGRRGRNVPLELD